MGKGGEGGGLKNWTIFMDAICVSSLIQAVLLMSFFGKKF